MTDIEKIAKRICTLNPNVISWEDLDETQRISWRVEARQIYHLIIPSSPAPLLSEEDIDELKQLTYKEAITDTDWYVDRLIEKVKLAQHALSEKHFRREV